MKTFLLALALALSGCTVIDAAQVAGQAKELVVEDINEAREWRGHHKALLAVIEQAYLDRAQQLMAAGDWDQAEIAFEAVLQFSTDNQPQILYERLKARVDKIKADERPD